MSESNFERVSGESGFRLYLCPRYVEQYEIVHFNGTHDTTHDIKDMKTVMNLMTKND